MENLSLPISSSTNLVFSRGQSPYFWNKHMIKSSSFIRIKCCSHRGSDGERAAQASSIYALPRNIVSSRVLSDEPSTMPLVLPEVPRSSHGIGILQFLHGKNYLITGATGFLGKAFLEKLLRSTPAAGKIYLMIKAANKEAAAKRLQNEIIDSELFGCLKQMYGDSYEDIMKKTLVPVVGDASQPNLGMDADIAAEIANEVDVIVNSAANTTFDERYDVAINVNIKGPSRLLNFAKMCKKLKIFVHISTAYANGEREGVVFEKPFTMGDSIVAEKAGSGEFFPPLDIDAEIDLASRVASSTEKNKVTQKLKELGLERAKSYGWRNTYEFSKAMAEMLLNSTRGDIPIVILRPSIIESTLAEPVPGWIHGNRMLDPIITSYGKGLLPGFLYDPQCVIDVVPADIVVNAILAAMAKHGTDAKPGLNIYHVSSGVVNPVKLIDVFKYSHKYFSNDTNVMRGRMHLNELQMCSSLESFKSYMVDFLRREASKLASDDAALDKNSALPGRLAGIHKKRMDHFIQMAKVYQPYLFYNGRFDNSNTQNLIPEMSGEERRQFGIDLEGVDWEDYFVNVHIPGLMKYVLKK